MPTTIYDSSLITKRNQSKAVADSFINRIQNASNPSTGSAPLLGITEQSIINTIKNGQMTDYRKNEGGCTNVSVGCPCLPPTLYQPAPIYGWATRATATSAGGLPINNNSMNFDSTKSNFYVTMQFGTAGASPPDSTLTLYSSNGTSFTPLPVLPLGLPQRPGMCVAKYDLLGNVVWASLLQTTNTSAFGMKGSVSDNEDNLIVTGRFLGTLSIYNSDGSLGGTLTATVGTGTDAFIIKYTPSGMVKWVTLISGSTDQNANYIIVDSFNNIYVTLTSVSAITVNSVGGAPAPFTINPPAGSNFDAYLVKYDKNGIAQRGTLVNSIGGDSGYALAIDSSNNIYMYGNYITGQLNIYNANPPPTQPTFISSLPAASGNNDIFLVKYTSELQFVWATRFVSIGGNDTERNLSIDSNGNIYLTGAFGGQMTFYNNGGTQIFRTIFGNPTGFGAFVAVYNTDGVGIWVAYMDSTNTDVAIGITYDSIGNVYVTGTYLNTLLVFNSNGTTNVSLAGGSNTNTFLLKYNSVGCAQWATRLESSLIDVTSSQLLIDSNNYLYFSGWYGFTTGAELTFYNSNGLSSGVTLPNSGNSALFIAKYNSDGFLIPA
jgi:hypothetical protein